MFPLRLVLDTNIIVSAALKPLDVLFIEEPAVPGNIEVFKRLKEAINIPLATGERDRTIWEMIPYLQNRCIDILQDPALGKALGRRGKAHVRKHFLTPRYLRDYLEIFSELLGVGAGRSASTAGGAA